MLIRQSSQRRSAPTPVVLLRLKYLNQFSNRTKLSLNRIRANPSIKTTINRTTTRNITMATSTMVVTEEVTEVVTEVEIVVASEVATEVVIEVATEVVTEVATEVVTEEATEADTEVVIEVADTDDVFLPIIFSAYLIKTYISYNQVDFIYSYLCD